MPEWKYTNKKVTKEEAQRSLAAIKSACFHCETHSNDFPMRKATLTPHRITDSETDELKSLGITDSQIVEILGVMELFTGYNKFLDALAVEIDFPGM